jgi:hypothetical protein
VSLATKYYEEAGFVNKAGYCFYKNSHLQYAVSIPAQQLSAFECHLLNIIDFDLYINKEVHYDKYFKGIMAYFDALSGGGVEEENVEMEAHPTANEVVALNESDALKIDEPLQLMNEELKHEERKVSEATNASSKNETMSSSS